jgi:hypothetical protein
MGSSSWVSLLQKGEVGEEGERFKREQMADTIAYRMIQYSRNVKSHTPQSSSEAS